jgi:site-specific DNA recombinase
MAGAKSPLRRCAIYTRKSSEEGLEQDFNSLHAQREACEAFVRSQQGEGWRVVETAYDDGGLSGGTIERPALQRLLGDVGQGQVDTVVVYKVDRLTRSLMDFAKIVELFDRHSVSFVAVTQQFNTTTSMGRLTLNILLSFAQFEREVTGERIRDKIAASKRKGMWMGGVTPLGYEIRNRKLTILPAEAETVCLIYRRYQELGSVRLLRDDLDRRGVRSKVRTYEDGRQAGGRSFSRGALYALLSNPIYIGEISHKGARHPGQHEAILERGLWDAVQRQLLDHGPGVPRAAAKVMPSPLKGKLFDAAGARLTPSHAIKEGRRYRYYVSHNLVTGTRKDAQEGWRLPAAQIEKLVAVEAAAIFTDRLEIGAALENAGWPSARLSAAFADADRWQRRLLAEAFRADALAVVVERAELGRDGLRLTVSLGVLADGIAAAVTRDIPLQLKRRGVETRLVIESRAPSQAKPDPILLKEIARAHRCFEALLTRRVASIAELAAIEGVDDRYVSNVLPLAFLAPEIVEAIVRGIQPPDLTATKLLRRIDLPLDWHAQKRDLGFS